VLLAIANVEALRMPADGDIVIPTPTRAVERHGLAHLAA
jgi:hypothetical protein